MGHGSGGQRIRDRRNRVHSRHWGYIRHKGHSIPTELEPLQAQMLGGLAVRPCHAGAPGRLSQQGPTNTQGPPAAMPDPDNRSRRAPGSSGLAGLWPVAGLGAMSGGEAAARAREPVLAGGWLPWLQEGSVPQPQPPAGVARGAVAPGLPAPGPLPPAGSQYSVAGEQAGMAGGPGG